MKKAILCLVLLTGLPICKVYAQQTVTQEQYQQADAQLNQVYQQLRGTLNDSQKQQLKQAQRDWIKKRDAFVAANPGNPQGALYQATMQRVEELSDHNCYKGNKKEVNTKQQHASEELNKNEGIITYALALPEFPRDGANIDVKENSIEKITPVNQTMLWDHDNILSEVLGHKIRCISFKNDPNVYLFDSVSKLYLGKINCDDFKDSGWAEGEPPWMLLLSSDETLLYFQRWQRHGGIQTYIVDTNKFKTIRVTQIQTVPLFLTQNNIDYALSCRPCYTGRFIRLFAIFSGWVGV